MTHHPAQTTPSLARALPWLGASLSLLLGAGIFRQFGQRHPIADSRLGPINSDAYFTNFAAHIRASSDWIAIHDGILAGPLLWALGALVLLHATSADRRGRLGPVTFLFSVGGALWAVAFVLDGFLSPGLAAQLAAATPDTAGPLISALRNNALVVLRAGTIGWIGLGLGLAWVSVSLAVSLPGRWARLAFGACGVLVGTAPALVMATGVVNGGLFISPVWGPITRATVLWVMVLGSVAGWRGLRVLTARELDRGTLEPIAEGAPLAVSVD